MIIGVDAGALSIADDRLKVGVYHITHNFLRAVRKVDAKNKYRLYSFAPIAPELTRVYGPRMENRVLRPTKGWFSLAVPAELLLHNVDAFLGLSQALPRHRGKNLGFIYDLAYEHFPHAYPDSYARLKRQTDELVERASHIVTISEATKHDIITRYHVSPKQISVCSLGVDDLFRKKGASATGMNPYFLFVGALKRLKNIPTILTAFSLFLKQYKKPFDLYLVGGNYWEDPDIAPTISKLGIERFVRFLGPKSHTELASYYRGATALVTPSLWEGFCLPAVEAMSSGCPVIASRSGSLPEVVGDAGILIEATDHIALGDAMLTFALKPEIRSTFVERGLKKSAPYTWEAFAEGVVEVLRAL